MSLVLRNKGKGMQRSSEQPLVGEERYVTTLITAAKETIVLVAFDWCVGFVLAEVSGKLMIRPRNFRTGTDSDPL